MKDKMTENDIVAKSFKDGIPINLPHPSVKILLGD